MGSPVKSSNGRQASDKLPAGQEPVANPLEDVTNMLRASAELSRKLQWAIGTVWFNWSGERSRKRQIDYLATRYAAEIVNLLRQPLTEPTVKPKLDNVPQTDIS